MMSGLGEGREHVAHLLVATEKHIAFLEGAIRIEMMPMLREEDLIISEIAGMDANLACRLVFPSRTSETGWMDDTLLFKTLEDLVIFIRACRTVMPHRPSAPAWRVDVITPMGFIVGKPAAVTEPFFHHILACVSRAKYA